MTGLNNHMPDGEGNRIFSNKKTSPGVWSGLVLKKYFQNPVVVDIVTVTGISYFPGGVL
jgi:hypothetical protein